MEHARTQGISERRAYRLVNQPRGTQRYQPLRREDEDPLTQAIVDLASQYGRYGYRRITQLLQDAGWHVGKDRVQCIGGAKACRSLPNRSRAGGCGSTMEVVSVCGPNTPTMFGVTTLCKHARTMAAVCGY